MADRMKDKVVLLFGAGSSGEAGAPWSGSGCKPGMRRWTHRSGEAGRAGASSATDDEAEEKSHHDRLASRRQDRMARELVDPSPRVSQSL